MERINRYIKTAILKSTLASLLVIVFSCDVIEIEQLNSTNDDTTSVTEDGLQGPTTVPSIHSEVLAFLHGGSNKAWDAEGFEIFGMSGFLTCRLDDSMILSSDGDYLYDGGSSLCGAEDDTRVKEGTWELSEDLKSIVFTEGTNSYSAKLIGITTDQITLQGDYQGLELNAVYTSN